MTDLLFMICIHTTKHNLENGWNNTDGANDNNSWNCGAEGDTNDYNINKLRIKMVKMLLQPLCAVRDLLFSLQAMNFATLSLATTTLTVRTTLSHGLTGQEKKSIRMYLNF